MLHKPLDVPDWLGVEPKSDGGGFGITDYVATASTLSASKDILASSVDMLMTGAVTYADLGEDTAWADGACSCGLDHEGLHEEMAKLTPAGYRGIYACYRALLEVADMYATLLKLAPEDPSGMAEDPNALDILIGAIDEAFKQR